MAINSERSRLDRGGQLWPPLLFQLGCSGGEFYNLYIREQPEMQEIDCPRKNAAAELRIESLPFSGIPGQSRLFLDYLSDPLSLREYYPSAVASHTQVSDRIPQILDKYVTDRSELCGALDEMNRSFGASLQALENIRRLRHNDSVAVVTGQQAGLFSGPLYTIYKALSAVRMAECVRGRGFDAVPVFWAATEDHDFEEVASATVISLDGRLARVGYDPLIEQHSLPVGSIILDHSIEMTTAELFATLAETEFTPQLSEVLKSTYRPGNSFGAAFAGLISRLFARYGLIVVDPLDSRLRQLAAPLYREAIQKSDEIVQAVRRRSKRLESDGFHAQVRVEEDYFPLFWHDAEGVRRPLKRTPAGDIRVSGEKLAFTKSELIEIADQSPDRLSPGVMLRPVVQDYLFPTVCYFGGSAEIAYFGQNSEVYRILDRPATTIFHRQSFTVAEAKHQNTLAKYGLEFVDLFDGFETLLPRIIEKYIDPGTARLFPEAEERINTELSRLDQHFSQLDPTLAATLAKRRRKILYHIAALRDKFYRTRIKKDEEANRRLRTALASLLPEGRLQERSLNVSMFLNRYGSYFIDWMYDAVDLDDRGHRVVYL